MRRLSPSPGLVAMRVRRVSVRGAEEWVTQMAFLSSHRAGGNSCLINHFHVYYSNQKLFTH